VSINLNNDFYRAAGRQEEKRPAPEEERNAATKDRRMKKSKDKNKKLARLEGPTSMLGRKKEQRE